MTATQVERQQVWVYLAAIGTGLLLGSLWPGLGGPAASVLWPALAVLLYAAFTQVPLLRLRAAVRDARFTSAALLGNFVLVPCVVWALVQVLPDDPALRLGVLLVLLVPCTDWFITFTQLGGGDVPRAIAISPVHLLLQLLLLPLYLHLLGGVALTSVIGPSDAVPALAVVLVPLVLAAATERWSGARPHRQAVRARLGRLPVPLLALVVLLVATAQVDTVLGRADVLPVVVPVFLAFLAAAVALAALLARAFRLPPEQARTLTFSLGTRNSFVVLPFALALPAGLEVAAVVVVLQSLVELLGMIGYLRWVPRAFPAPGPAPGRSGADGAGGLPPGASWRGVVPPGAALDGRERDMCRAARCTSCGRTTWAGCGEHVDQVMAGVPPDQQCTCDRRGPGSAAGAPASAAVTGRLRRLLGRS